MTFGSSDGVVTETCVCVGEKSSVSDDELTCDAVDVGSLVVTTNVLLIVVDVLPEEDARLGTTNRCAGALLARAAN
jgi:hypothetical protein